MTWAMLNGEPAPSSGPGGDGHAGGDGRGPATSTKDLAATCGIFAFNGKSIVFEVTNTGGDSWQAGDVAYDCTVWRAGTLVQQENQAIVGLGPGNQFLREVPFLGTDVDGEYLAVVSVIAIQSNDTLATDSSQFTSPMVPESGGF
jgi:hypothetical protein